MSTYTQVYYHIVFSTWHREPVLLAAGREKLFGYIWGLSRNKNCHLYRINGMEDHLHILTSLHPTVCLSDFVKSVKGATQAWNRREKAFPQFDLWQDGYGAFTHSAIEKDIMIKYIADQQIHHQRVTFQDELRALLVEAGIHFQDKYLL